MTGITSTKKDKSDRTSDWVEIDKVAAAPHSIDGDGLPLSILCKFPIMCSRSDAFYAYGMPLLWTLS
jgi:hypothetical protein